MRDPARAGGPGIQQKTGYADGYWDGHKTGYQDGFKAGRQDCMKHPLARRYERFNPEEYNREYSDGYSKGIHAGFDYGCKHHGHS